MRLLKVQDGELTLTKNFIREIPPYAILSHTWGEDEEEVSFTDILDGTGNSKSGYKKLDFCKRQAELDGLDHFWVDTCCINKSDSTELQEAINSMFRWYKEATKCYVYLMDVTFIGADDSGEGDPLFWESAFRESRWFTRGWTLQELIAPSSVEFFSSDYQWLGDKLLLEPIICDVTGLPEEALRGNLSSFNYAERLSWSSSRETTREEDRVYSLFGILGVFMAILYGEGGEHASLRLQEAIDSRERFLRVRKRSPESDTVLPGLSEDNRYQTAVPAKRTKANETTHQNHPQESRRPDGTKSEAQPKNSTKTFSKSNSLDFYSELLATNNDKMPSHRVVATDSGERLLSAGATWDLIISHESFKKGLLNVSDVSERLKKRAKSDGIGPVFGENAILRSIEESVEAGGDDLL